MAAIHSDKCSRPSEVLRKRRQKKSHFCNGVSAVPSKCERQDLNLRTPMRSDLESGSFGLSETLAQNCAQPIGRSSDIDLQVIYRQHV